MLSRFNASEVIVSSHSGKVGHNWTIQEAHTGSVLARGNQGRSSPKTLCLVGRDYLVNAVPNLPLLQVWPFQHKVQMKKMVVPEVVTALAVTEQGHHMVAAVENKLHIWEIATGNLLRVFSVHYQKVNCIKFTKDGSYFVTGGADAYTMVWTLSGVLSSEISNAEESGINVIKPTHIWKDHTLAVEDIYIGYFGSKANVVSVSTDQTCKIRRLRTGQLIFSIYMDVGLVSVCMDPAERFVFLGTENGDIRCIVLASCWSTNEIHYDATKEDVFKVFSGHKKAVSCLSLSIDACTLLSGSKDGSLKLWNVFTQICNRTLQYDGVSELSLTAYNNILLKDLNKQPFTDDTRRYIRNKDSGPITNAMLVMTPPLLRRFKDSKTEVCNLDFGILQRTVHKEGENVEENTSKNPVPVQLQNQKLRTWDLACGNDILDGIKPMGDSEYSKAQLKTEISTVKKTNEQMYGYLINTFMSGMKN